LTHFIFDETGDEDQDIATQLSRLALERRVSALADISKSPAGAVYQQLDTRFLKQITIASLQLCLPSSFS